MLNCIVPDELIVDMDRWRDPDPYLTTNLYPVYRDIVRRLRPTTILEIGVRYGYSLAVALDAAPTIRRAIALDMDDGVTVYGGETGAFSRATLTLQRLQPERWPNVRLEFVEVNTQDWDYLPLLGTVDMAYVDGDHSVRGCLHDLGLVLPRLAPGGAIVVDDIDHHPELREPVERFCHFQGLTPEYVPDGSHRGRFVIRRSDDRNDSAP